MQSQGRVSHPCENIEHMFAEDVGKGIAVASEASATPGMCRCEAAARWAVFAYEVGGIDAEIEALPGPGAAGGLCDGWAVIPRGLNRIECVLDANSDLAAASDRIRELSEAGWDVWALVPLARLAGAHDAFRSEADYVQGWWERDQQFAFTTPEIP